MSEYISLPRKYRPQKLDDQVGQDNIVKMIYNSIEMNRLSHAMVFVGPAGTGKTSLARALSKTLNCKADVKPCCKCSICETIANGKNLDVLEMNAADKRGIDDMRDVLSKIRFKPMSKYKIIILDECFYKDTLITMSDFTKKKISEINVGDTILNSNGIDTVEKVIVNNVPLERLVLLKLNNGNEILTTLDHKFYTENGWTECHNLKVGELLYGNVEQIRVESLTFYKQGDRREHFERYISDKERTCGYIEMYDLTVKEQHNYIANDVLVHNCHMITNESWNILLKDLEEPPEYAILILCTTNPEKIPETILSRCQIYEFHSIKQNDIANRLRYICEQEEFDYEDDAMNIIAKHSKGGMRDAISSLEQVACFSNGNITKQDTIDSLGIISDDCFIEIANCLYGGDIDGAIEVLDSLVDKNKPLLSIFYQLQELYGDEQKAFFRKTKENILQYGRNNLLEITKLFIEYEAKMKYSNDKYFILTSLFYDISHIGNNASMQNIFQDSDIEKRILALEDALKNGKLQNFEKIGNIQRALNGKKAFPTKDERRKEDAKQKQVDDIVSEFASLSKGEIL